MAKTKNGIDFKIGYHILVNCFIISICNSQTKHNPDVEQLLNATKKNMVFVEGGIFMQGHKNATKASAVHQVTLDSYSISKHETTFEEYDVYTKEQGLKKILEGSREADENYNYKKYNGKYGAWGMTWYEAQTYCQWLGKQLDTPMDLPTEAQWEYAARSRGLDVNHATDNGKIEGSFTEKRNYNGSDVIIGSFPPNPLGIYDMSGGIREWTLDWFGAYPRTPVVNPVRDSIKYSKSKVIRGTHDLYYSTYSRAGAEPTNIGSGTGVRCVCNQKTPMN